MLDVIVPVVLLSSGSSIRYSVTTNGSLRFSFVMDWSPSDRRPKGCSHPQVVEAITIPMVVVLSDCYLSLRGLLDRRLAFMKNSSFWELLLFGSGYSSSSGAALRSNVMVF